MPTNRELDTMINIQLICDQFKRGEIPAWRAIEKIAGITIEHQRKEWDDDHPKS